MPERTRDGHVIRGVDFAARTHRPAQEPPRIGVVPDLHRATSPRLTLLRSGPASIHTLSPRPAADPTTPAA